MKKEDAIRQYEKMTYDLSKYMSKISDIKQRVEYINKEMDWDGMFEVDFSEAMEKLGDVLAAMVEYSFEEKYRKSDIDEMKSTIDAYEKYDLEENN